MGIGRNEPCPCGSGKKYKKCCLSKSSAGKNTGLADLTAQLGQMDFQSMEEANSFIQQNMSKIQQLGEPDFFGLTPDQMHKMLYQAFDSPEIAVLSTQLKAEPKAPIVDMAKFLLAAMGKKSLRTTSKGNLPQHVSGELWRIFIGKELAVNFPDDTTIREENVPIVRHFRTAMEVAGFLEAKKTVVKLTPEFHELHERSGFREIYPRLFRTYCEEVYWLFSDYGTEFRLLQTAWLFHLFMFKRFSHKLLHVDEYFKFFNRAFPNIVERDGGSNAELKDHYRSVVMYRWSMLFGLMTFTDQEEGKTTPILDDLITFAPNVKRLLKQRK